jgi:predicted secreted Zn-dependent protease
MGLGLTCLSQLAYLHFMFRESFPVLALSFSLITSSVAQAKDVSAVVAYPVQGKTAAELYNYIKTKSPKVVNNATFAFTMIATKTEKTEKQSADGCRYPTFKTSAIFNFVLPKHPKPGTIKPKTQPKWLAFESYLLQHEKGHREIWRACFAAYDQEAKALTAKDCKALDTLREKTFTKLKLGCLKQDEQYDVVFRKEVLKHPFVKAALAARDENSPSE